MSKTKKNAKLPFLAETAAKKKSLGEVVAENRYRLLDQLCKTPAFDSAWSN